jgi:hypothetical protein
MRRQLTAQARNYHPKAGTHLFPFPTAVEFNIALAMSAFNPKRTMQRKYKYEAR